MYPCVAEFNACAENGFSALLPQIGIYFDIYSIAKGSYGSLSSRSASIVTLRYIFEYDIRVEELFWW
jgi:hypothetical protein